MKEQVTLYHNPKCSKSRQVLGILQDLSIAVNIIDYLITPLNIEEVKQLRAYFDLKDFVRHEDTLFKTLDLSLENETQILNAIVENPILMQRPILVFKDKAIIARPPEKVLTFLS